MKPCIILKEARLPSRAFEFMAQQPRRRSELDRFKSAAQSPTLLTIRT